MPTADCPEARLVLAVVRRAVLDVANDRYARGARRFIRSRHCQCWLRMCLDALGRDDLDPEALMRELRRRMV